MWMELHGLANDISDLVKAAILHIEQGLEDAALDRFQTIFNGGNGALPDDIGGVFKKIFIKELVKFARDCVHTFGAQERSYASWRR